jgi:two-component system, sporulation sensor kinase D
VFCFPKAKKYNTLLNNTLNSYEIKKFIKIILLLLAIFIGGLTLYFSQELAKKVAQEEKKKIATWAKAVKNSGDPEVDDANLTFYLELIQDNTTIPAIVVDEKGKITQQFINLDKKQIKRPGYLEEKRAQFAEENEPIPIPIAEGIVHKVYYGESSVLKQLRYYPYVVLGVVALFILVSYFAFSVSRRAEENQVWVGLAKETAHQLGTPISSLMGWVDVIEMGEMPENAGDEMRKDIRRLQIITERFSKIGSEPILKKVELNEALKHAVEYMKTRSGKGVHFEIQPSENPVYVMLNLNLFDWVIENLTKNSIDAMEGAGNLTYRIRVKAAKITLDVTDTGKGISRNHFKSVFKPGFTTKRRGWGLGLSLAKRIINDYHQGHIYVKESVPGVRTTMRIVLNESV